MGAVRVYVSVMTVSAATRLAIWLRLRHAPLPRLPAPVVAAVAAAVPEVTAVPRTFLAPPATDRFHQRGGFNAHLGGFRYSSAEKVGTQAGERKSAPEGPPLLISWGQNAYGELAHGDVLERSAPEVVRYVQQIGLQVKQVVAGNEHTAILTESGQVYCCGYNDSGQCGLGTTQRVSTAFHHVEALQNERIVMICSGNGSEHMLAITNDGRLFAWGYNSRGQLGIDSTTSACFPTLNEFLSTKRVFKVACSYHHTMLSTSDDVLFAMGRNDFGQLGIGTSQVAVLVPTPLTQVPSGNVLAIACGQYHSVFSIEQAGVYSCGKNDYGQLGIGSTEQPLSVPVSVCAPLDKGGNVITQLSCGYYHSLGLTEQGRVYAWGRNDYGQLGIGSLENSRRPRLVEDVPPVVNISSGCYHSLMLTDGGKVYAQGRNNHGQLGTDADSASQTNSEQHVIVPRCVDSLKDHCVSTLAAGFYHSLCITGQPPSRALEIPAPTLSIDFARMLNNPARSDVVFVVQGQQIYAHRCIIMARCEPLERMVDGPMRESQQREIHLPDIDYRVGLAFFEYLYTDAVKELEPQAIDLEFALDLQAVADQFLVDRLKRLCEGSIERAITVENCGAMLAIADMHQALALRKRCLEFILLHKNFENVIITEGFLTLPKHLLAEVLVAAHSRGVSIRPPI